MMTNKGSTAQSAPPKGRLIIGGVIFVAGFFAPGLIPLVVRSNLSIGWKSAISGVLALGVPELAMVVAVAILGKPGYRYLKKCLLSFLKQYGPPQIVSRWRYRAGLVLFTIPLMFAWAAPYFGHHLPYFDTHLVTYALIGDGLFLISLWLLGGEFWDKLRSLFVHGATAEFPENKTEGGSKS